jgi:hypothetical protein
LYIAQGDSIHALNSTGKVREEFIFTDETVKSKQSIVQYKYAVWTGGKVFQDMMISNAFHVTEF